MTAIEKYLENLNPIQKEQFERVRNIVKETVPDFEEKISYGVPTFTYKGTYLLYFGAFKSHMSLYPVSDDMIKEVGDDLAKFRTSTGTLQFTEDKPIPDTLIKGMIQFRKRQIDHN